MGGVDAVSGGAVASDAPREGADPPVICKENVPQQDLDVQKKLTEIHEMSVGVDFGRLLKREKRDRTIVFGEPPL